MSVTIALFFQLLQILEPQHTVWDSKAWFYIRLPETSPNVEYSIARSWDGQYWEKNVLPPIIGTGGGLVGYIRKQGVGLELYRIEYNLLFPIDDENGASSIDELEAALPVAALRVGGEPLNDSGGWIKE